MRDHFDEKTKRTLEAQVGHRCSKPDCRASTSGPTGDGTGRVSVGDAAHIAAASPGGPRFDATLTPAERSDASNGIWLCALHARQVDRDEARFTKEQLLQWKRDAMAAADAALGIPIRPSRVTEVDRLKTEVFPEICEWEPRDGGDRKEISLVLMNTGDTRFHFDVDVLAWFASGFQPAHDDGAVRVKPLEDWLEPGARVTIEVEVDLHEEDVQRFLGLGRAAVWFAEVQIRCRNPLKVQRTILQRVSYPVPGRKPRSKFFGVRRRPLLR